MNRRRMAALAAAMLGALVLGGALYGWLGDEIAAFLNYAVSKGTHPGLFLLMFAVLPLLGFPITVFLVLIGAKFGAWAGVLIMAAGMPLHLLAAFGFANSFLRPLIRRYMEKANHPLPEIPPNRVGWFSVVFMAVPGLSYILKNYILAFSGVPFRWYFLSGYLVQGAMGVPFVIAGDAVAAESLLLLAAVLAALLLIYGVVYKIRRRHTWPAS